MTTTTRPPVQLTCVALVVDGTVIPVTGQPPVIIEGDHETQTPQTQELALVTDKKTDRALTIAAIKAAIDTLVFDDYGKMEHPNT